MNKVWLGIGGVVVCLLLMVVDVDLNWFNWDWVGEVWSWINGLDLN